MLDGLPKEPEDLSWSAVGLLSLIIFFTVPLARTIEAFIVARWGEEFFLFAGITTLVLAAVAVVVNLRNRAIGISAYLAGLAVGCGFVAAAYSLTDSAIEVIHFVEYGLLGLLVYRALRHRIHDYSIYFASALV
ncbi:MAG: hypothetical protein U9P11_06540, partial [Pseudomonadota bacterium]|nr:hypothetical protein [Pseudomonadota bacterium]